jgi:hypothetical protein
MLGRRETSVGAKGGIALTCDASLFMTAVEQ